MLTAFAVLLAFAAGNRGLRTVFFFLSKLLDVGLSPLSWGMLLLGLAIGTQIRRPQAKRLQRALLGAALAVLYLFSIEPVSNWLMYGLEHPRLSTMKTGTTYDAVIVLGGMVNAEATKDSGEPAYADPIERLLTGYDLLRTGRARDVVVTGGVISPDQEPVAEARVLAAQLEAWGIAKERIFVEDRSRNTREDAVESEKIVRQQGWSSILLVTSAAHMPRALGCFRAVGLEVDTLSVDLHAHDPRRRIGNWLPRASHLAQSSDAIREYVGRLVYRLRGYAR